MDIQNNAMVSYQLLSLPMKIAQLTHLHSQKVLDLIITNKVEAILESNRAYHLDLWA